MWRPRNTRRRSSQPAAGQKLGVWTAVIVLLLLSSYAAVVNMNRPTVTGDRLRFDSFVALVERGRIRDATILNYDSYVVGTYETDDGSLGRYQAPYLRNLAEGGIGTQERLIDLLIDNNVPTTIDQQFEKTLLGPASIILPALIFIVVAVYLVLSYRSGTGLFGLASGARKISPRESGATFAQVAGQESAIAEVKEIAQFLSDRERFASLGAVIPKGVLLYGPPGCGKTLLARALAGEAGASFYSISGSDFVELYVGVGAARVRDLFEQARANAPAIVFIDELDAIGRRRTGGGPTGSADEQEQALNQILAEMDGFSPMEGIVVVGATNRPDVIDPALLRPGRFDRTIGLERPGESDRLAILQVHARGKKLDPAVDLAGIARRAVGMSGADLANVVNEAALLAARDRRPAVAHDDLEQALERTREAPERQKRLAMRDRSIGRSVLSEERVTFETVAGVDEAIVELREIKDHLSDPERYLKMGARAPRGYLLLGPPGCGKTLLARAVANESNAVFLSVAATEFTEVFVGEGPARVRDLFAEARAAAPAILFIDEIDAIGARRGASADGHREREQTLNQILIELDGFSPRSGVVVIAASNRPEILDPALVRPGRFDRQIHISLPDRQGRREILAVHAEGKPLALDVDLDAVAAATAGFSGADLANVMNEAALLAARANEPLITTTLIDEAMDRAAGGIGRSGALSEEERRRVAYHEAGHVLAAWALRSGHIPHKVTIVPRGERLGSAWIVDDSERTVPSRRYLMELMAIGLGGRTAEELVFDQVTAGAANDLARAAAIARRMVVEFGMSEIVGPVAYADDYSGREARYSEETQRTIDSEVQKLVREAQEMARSILRARRSDLDRLADALSEKESLTANEIEELLGTRSVS